MYQCEASCEEILRWFHSERCREDILLLWLGPGKEDEDLLYSIVHNVNTIDAVLQDEVAFLLVGATGTVSAARIGEFTPLFETVRRRTDWTAPKIKKLVRSTLSTVPDFAAAIGAQPRDLPAIAIVTKYAGSVFLAPFRGPRDFQSLKTWLIELQSYVTEYRTAASTFSTPDPMIAERLLVYSENESAVAGRVAEIAAALDRYFRFNGDAGPAGAAIRGVLTRAGPFDLDAFEPAWQQLNTELANAQQLPRSRINKAIRHLRTLQLPALPEEFPRSLLAAREQANAAHEQLERRLKAFAGKGVGARLVLPDVIKSGSIIPKVNKQLSQISRLVRLLHQLFPGLLP